jgi:hypothetical protein
MKEHANGASYHNRYPYSGKIYCEEHGTTYHRQVLENKSGIKEMWQCKVYRTKGRAGCSAPQVRSEELDAILAQIFTQMMKDKGVIIDSLLAVLQSVPQEVDYSAAKRRMEEEMAAVKAKKDRLLELSMADALTIAEFKSRNEAFNQQLRNMECQLATIQIEEHRQKGSTMDMGRIRQALDRELSFEGGINSNLVATILEKVVVKKESNKEEIHLDIYLKLGAQFQAILRSASFNRGRSTMRWHRIRRI